MPNKLNTNHLNVNFIKHNSTKQKRIIISVNGYIGHILHISKTNAYSYLTSRKFKKENYIYK